MGEQSPSSALPESARLTVAAVARRLGVAQPVPREATPQKPARRGMHGRFASFRQSVLKLFA